MAAAERRARGVFRISVYSDISLRTPICAMRPVAPLSVDSLSVPGPSHGCSDMSRVGARRDPCSRTHSAGPGDTRRVGVRHRVGGRSPRPAHEYPLTARSLSRAPYHSDCARPSSAGSRQPLALVSCWHSSTRLAPRRPRARSPPCGHRLATSPTSPTRGASPPAPRPAPEASASACPRCRPSRRPL